MAHRSAQPDRYDLPLTTCSTKAVERYVRGVDLFLSGNTGAEESLERAILADEDFALAHAALAAIDWRGRRFDQALERIQRAKQLAQRVTRRERQHVEVIAEAALGCGRRALRLSQEHLDDFPRDAYILQLYVFLRRGPGCREMSSAILDTIERLEPAYGDDWYYTGTRSFYLHELDRFDESRRFAELSLTGNPRNGNAAHNLAHCFYETADYTGGLDFLNDWVADYHPDAPHYSHLNWHLALFELAQGRYRRSYELYREGIRPSVLRRHVGGMGPPIADAASLFWRYKLYDSPLERSEDWREIAEFAEAVIDGPRVPFYDAHCALAFAATGNDAAMSMLIDRLRAAADEGNSVIREVTLPLVLGIAAFGRGDYAETIRQIEPILDDLVRIDGSEAQRMVFEETLLRACMLTGRYDKVEQLLRERLEHRHNGRDLYWLAEVSAARRNALQAETCRDQARRLWSAADPDAPEIVQLTTRAGIAADMRSALAGSVGRKS